MIVEAPPLRPAQAEAWHALFEVHDRIPTGWALVGGQMVQSLCWERGARPNRATVDADTALDVRAHPQMLLTFTTALRDLGFTADGTSFEGHQHRWIRGDARVEGRVGTVRRPTLQGAILAKAAAVQIPGEDATRHLVDIATLGALVTRRDQVGAGITATERTRVLAATALLRKEPAHARRAGVDASVADRLRAAFSPPPT